MDNTCVTSTPTADEIFVRLIQCKNTGTATRYLNKLSPEEKACIYSSSPQQNFDWLKKCKTIKQARNYLTGLSPGGRISLYSVNAPLNLRDEKGNECDLLFYPETRPGKGNKFERTPPTQEHINEVYTSLFRMIEAAKAKARNNHKRLQIVVGDVHTDRSALAIMAMIALICSQLDIGTCGVEMAIEGRGNIFTTGKPRTGLKELIDKIRRLHKQNKHLSEYGGATATGQIHNADYIIELQLTKPQLFTTGQILANDPDFLTSGAYNTFGHTVDIYQEWSTDRDRGIKESLNAITKHSFNFTGIGHLSAVAETEPPEGFERLLISAANCYCNFSKEARSMPVFEDFIVLPYGSTDAMKKAIELGEYATEKKGAGTLPLVQVVLEGNFQSARTALEMALEANRNLGHHLLLSDPPMTQPLPRLEDASSSKGIDSWHRQIDW